MKIFVSWSKPRSKLIAEALREWLPCVIQVVQPWVSSEDIAAGERWNSEIDRELSSTTFGILCVTKENQREPWLLFEAGALAKTIDDSKVCPYLIDLEITDLEPGPLTKFNATEANKEGTRKLLRAINSSLAASKKIPLEEERLCRVFETFWPSLEKRIKAIPVLEGGKRPKRETKEMVEEILTLVRGLSREQKDEMPEPLLDFNPYRKGQRFEANSRVAHTRFGAGTVIGTDGYGERSEVLVVFDKHGAKRLLAKYSNLEVVQEEDFPAEEELPF